MRHNQSQFRADLYNGIADSMAQNDEVDGADLGRRIILPSSYTGGDRFMAQLYQDSMAIVRHFGKPSLFITMTANPQWKEFQDELLPGQTASDGPDLVCRVFKLKKKALLKNIKEGNVFCRFQG
jgi:hypothetical protein